MRIPLSETVNRRLVEAWKCHQVTDSTFADAQDESELLVDLTGRVRSTQLTLDVCCARAVFKLILEQDYPQFRPAALTAAMDEHLLHRASRYIHGKCNAGGVLVTDWWCVRALVQVGVQIDRASCICKFRASNQTHGARAWCLNHRCHRGASNRVVSNLSLAACGVSCIGAPFHASVLHYLPRLF